METFANIPHKLKRDGYGQLDRNNQALSPSNVKIDDRDTKDLLQFLYQYSRQINYYETTSEERAGDWVSFFRNSIPFQYAVIASFDLDALDMRFLKVEKAIKSRLSYDSLNLLFDLLFDLTDQISLWLADLEMDNSGLKRGMDNMIETNLKAQFLKLIKLANSAGKWGYKRTKNSSDIKKYWGINTMDLYGVDRTFLSLKGSVKHKVLDSFAVLEELYRVFWKAVQTIVSIANDGTQLEKSLTNEGLQNHEPHLGLLFAFLRLFKAAQGGLNDLSDAHLDFFYKKTLQLKNQDIVPDQAHLTFELAKKVEEDILIEKGTRFKAGKDINDQDIFFELDEELIVTKAKVADLRTLFIDRNKSDEYSEDIGTVEGVYMAPISNSADGKGEGFAKETEPRWATVGAKPSKWIDPDTTITEDHPYARLGFTMASKVLFLREGKRNITLSISLNESLSKLSEVDGTPMDDIGLANQLVRIFELSLTTEEGWMKLKDHTSDIVITPTVLAEDITFQFELPSDFPPVIASDPSVLETDYGHTLPMIKFDLIQVENNTEAANCYALLRQCMICNIKIDVTVCDVRQLVLQNDLSLIDINKPFMPFGPIPKKESSKFYIGSDEIFCKRWGSIEVNPVWKDLPDNLGTYYAAYTNPPTDNGAYTAKVELLYDKIWSDGTPNSVDLFTDSSSGICTGTGVFWKINQDVNAANVCTDLSNIQNGYLADTPCGFLRLELGDPDFLHDDYANTLIRIVGKFDEKELKDLIVALEEKTDDLRSAANDSHNAVNALNSDSSTSTINSAKGLSEDARDLAFGSETDVNEVYNKINAITDEDGNILLPNAPYTPLIESISVNYSAVAETTMEDEILFTHLHPYQGTYETLEVNTDDCDSDDYKTSVLPCFVDEGALFVGLENYQPGSNLSLYFQMEPASADPDVDKAVVCWEYLRNNKWHSLATDTQVLSDTTKGLIQSGIVKFTIPESISSDKTTIMPSNLHWLKARVLYRTAAISETFMVQTQAAQATFVPGEESDVSRLSEPLEAMTIAKFDAPIAAIKSVEQSYSAYGGRPLEDSDTFYQRISEHLRHKGRAISIYDYERIILQEFPDIYKVKCISHTLGRRGKSSDFELAPGFVTVVVIPDLNRVKAVNPLEPKVPAATLNAIKEILSLKRSPFVKVEVLNPIFETIDIQADVKFKAGKSNTFYKEKLKEDVTSFLAPWAFSETRQDISFGGSIYYSTILKFIEDQDYVDFLMNFKMLDKDGIIAEIIEASNSRVVLTSGENHQFNVIESTDQLITSSTTSETGIGYNKIPEI